MTLLRIVCVSPLDVGEEIVSGEDAVYFLEVNIIL